VDFKLTGKGTPVHALEDIDVAFETTNKRLLDEYYAEEEARYAEIQAESLTSEFDKQGDTVSWYEPEQPTEGQVRAEATDLEVMIDDYVDANPDTTVHIRYDEAGNLKTENAKAVLDEAKAEVSKVKKEQSLYDIAAECLTRG
jgi:hypothetical protein